MKECIIIFSIHILTQNLTTILMVKIV